MGVNLTDKNGETINVLKFVASQEQVNASIDARIEDGSLVVLPVNESKKLSDRVEEVVASLTDLDPTTCAQEVADARQGADGKMHNSLGEAVRNQIGELSGEIVELNSYVNHLNIFDNTKLIVGKRPERVVGISTYNSMVDDSVFVTTAQNFVCKNGDIVNTNLEGQVMYLYDSNGLYLDRITDVTKQFVINNENAKYFKLSYIKYSDGKINTMMLSINKDIPKEYTPYEYISIMTEEVKSLLKRESYITPEMFGAVGDGITDDTASLQSAINYCSTNSMTLKASKNKIYAISSGLKIRGKSKIDIDFGGATIKAIGDMRYMVHFNNHDYYPENDFNHYNRIGNFILDSNKNCNICLYIEYAVKVKFHDIQMLNVRETGIKLDEGGENFFDYIDMVAARGLTDFTNCYGIYTTASDCYWSNIYGMDFKIGIYNTGESHYSHIHMWLSRYFEDSVFFQQYGSNVYIFDAHADTYAIAFKRDTHFLMTLVGCTVFHNPNLLTREKYSGDLYVFYFTGKAKGAIYYSKFVNVQGCKLIGHRDIPTYLANIQTFISGLDTCESLRLDIRQNGLEKLVLSSGLEDKITFLQNDFRVKENRVKVLLRFTVNEKMFNSGSKVPIGAIHDIAYPFESTVLQCAFAVGSVSKYALGYCYIEPDGVVYFRHFEGTDFDPRYVCVSGVYDVPPSVG